MEVKLRDIGEGLAEAEINRFLVKPGDYVNADDPLIEIQTDKMTAEIPSPVSGTVKKFLVEEGDTVPVGTVLALLEAGGGDDATHADISKNENSGQAPVTLEGVMPLKDAEGKKTIILASPFTRKLARDHSVAIELVSGSGPSGRIVDADIYRHIENTGQGELTASGTKKMNTPQTKTETVGKTVPFRGRRKQIAKNLLHSAKTIPHCTHFEEIDVTNLLEFKEELKQAGTAISAAAFFIKALSVSLKQFPIFNAALDEDKEEIRLIDDHHIGIAVDAEDGLVVPVIRFVQKKTVTEINSEMKALTEKALAGKITVEDIAGGTFTVSNVGPLGGSIGATPIIQHPQTALVSFHKTKKRPVVSDHDEIVIRSMMNISMSFDHRVADGAAAVKFTNSFMKYIKNPKMLLLELV